MKKGAIESLLVFIIIIFIVIKVVVPKFTGEVGSQVTTYQALTELETAIEDIRQYYFKYGQMGQISMMTSVQGFEDTTIRLEKNTPVLYGIKDPKNGAKWCAKLEIIKQDNTDYIKVDTTSDRGPECKEFRSSPKFQSLKFTKLNY
ncbi:MAG: hypothetical protein GXZ15_05010 [Campylobacter sp.]|nr:hypothetical protein [Campylobacter sp.]